MRRLVLGAVMVMAAGAAFGQSQDWATVEKLQRKDMIIVESAGNFMRCRTLAVDATSLTCQEAGWHKPRVIYPVGKVQSVYHVHLNGAEKAKIYTSLGTVACLLGGIVAKNGTVFVIGFVGVAVMAFVGIQEIDHSVWDWATGVPPDGAFRRTETQDLIYVRAASN